MGCSSSNQKDVTINIHSLYHKIGGEDTITNLVQSLYDQMNQDDLIGSFFKNSQHPKMQKSLKDYLTKLFGGPDNCRGMNIIETHSSLKIQDNHFDRFMDLLNKVLEDQKSLSFDHKQEIKFRIELLRYWIVEDCKKEQPIYVKIGGHDVLQEIVKQFYKKILKDDKVNHFFKNTDMQKQKTQQFLFLQGVLGGPNDYNGKNMYDAHKNLKIKNADFDVIVLHLANTLREIGVVQILIEQIQEVCNSVKEDVCSGEKEGETNQNDQQQSGDKSIYEQIGGKDSVDLAVKKFYEKVLADDQVKHFFKDTDMKKQESQQIKFLTMVLGGPNEYEGKDMYEAHKGMNIQEEHFDKIVQLLAQTLTELGVGKDIIGKIADICATVKWDIVEKQKKEDENKGDQDTLYAKLGGEGAMDAAVKLFYEKMMADDSLNHFFKNTNMEVQAQQQKHFLTVAFGGPNNYNGRDMYTAHKGLGIKPEDFDKTVQNLAETLKELGVADDLIGQAGEVANSVKDDVVEK